MGAYWFEMKPEFWRVWAETHDVIGIPFVFKRPSIMNAAVATASKVWLRRQFRHAFSHDAAAIFLGTSLTLKRSQPCAGKSHR
jgi:hypothetical protein